MWQLDSEFCRSRRCSRRRFFAISITAGATLALVRSGVATADGADEFSGKLEEIISNSDLTAGLRLKEDIDLIAQAPIEERVPIRVPKSSTKISEGRKGIGWPSGPTRWHFC